MKHFFQLDCHYKSTGNFEKDEKLTKLSKLFGGKMLGVGLVGTDRGIDFMFETYRRAKNFYIQAHKRKFLDFAEISIVDKDEGKAWANIKELLG